jgi:hypothetical protein
MLDFLDYHEGCIDAIEGKLKPPDPPEDGASDKAKEKHKKLSEVYRKANSYAKQSISAGLSEAVYQKVMDIVRQHPTICGKHLNLSLKLPNKIRSFAYAINFSVSSGSQNMM